MHKSVWKCKIVTNKDASICNHQILPIYEKSVLWRYIRENRNGPLHSY
uniref:Uncharacterized protein n=1 Tax=Manihot esculenta TaxID=3983 RepID=A0A2C9VVJ8_MANES